MSSWVNRTAALAARNGTNTHTLTFTAASSGNLLVMLVGGPVTSTTPAGWTQVASPIGNTGLYLFTKTASAGESSASTTHNGSDSPVQYIVYEFPAGSALAGTTGSDTNQGPTSWATVTGLPGTPVTVFGVATDNVSIGMTADSTAFDAPWIEDLDALDLRAGGTDGAYLTVAYQDGYTSTSATPVGTITRTGGSGNAERITFAVSVAAGGGSPITFTTGIPSESDAPLASSLRKTRTTGQPSESDAALPRLRVKLRATGLPAETSSTLAVGRRKVRTTGLPGELDAALASVYTVTVTTGLPGESDSALAGRRIKIRTTGIPAELDAALATALRIKIRATGIPSELDAALPAALLVIPGRPVAGVRIAGSAVAGARPSSTVEGSDR